MKTLRMPRNGEAEAAARLETAGVHLTSERIAVGAMLFEAQSPITVHEIRMAISERFIGINAQKVYSHLRVFIEAGIVQKISTANHPDHYELISH